MNLPQHNIRTTEVRIEPDGFLQWRHGFIPLELPGICLTESVVSHTISRIDRYLSLQKFNTSIDIGVKDCDFTKQEIDLRQLRIKLKRLLQFFLRQVFELLAHQHLRID